MINLSTHDKPLAAHPWRSYRYKGLFGWVMIGASDDQDALNEAKRSVSGTPTMDRLQRWNGTVYEGVQQ